MRWHLWGMGGNLSHSAQHLEGYPLHAVHVCVNFNTDLCMYCDDSLMRVRQSHLCTEFQHPF